MSARQRFIAGGKSTPAKSTDADATDPGIRSTTDKQESVALKDASNSPHLERESVRNNTHNKKDNINDAAAPPAVQPPASVMSGIDKPLNLGSLTRSKPKKAPDSDSQKKRDKNTMVDRLKENDPISRIRSPRPLLMSPRRMQSSGSAMPHLFNPLNGPPLSDDQSAPSFSAQKQPSHHPNPSMVHLSPNSPRHLHTPVALSGNMFASPGQSLMNGFPPPASHPPYGEPLEPSRREVFPMRSTIEEQTEETHTFNSLSPPSPAQQFFREKRAYEYQAPINVDEGDDEDIEAVSRKHNQRMLRRATKRLDQHDSEDGSLTREGKRVKLDLHPEMAIDQHIDLTYEHPGRPSRSSTPKRHYQTPVRIDPFNYHHTEPGFRLQPNAYAQNSARFGEENRGLYHLLGVEVDQYLAEHIEQYEAAKKRWTSCSMEEWKAGAEEISRKFSKLVDFVKEHMTTKLTLYATLHDKVAQHKVILGERRTMLKNVQEKLVKNSGTVLGSTANGAS